MFGRSTRRGKGPGSRASSERRGRWTGLAVLLLGALLLEASFAPAASADPSSPLVVTKTANPNPVASGDQLTYTIGIENSGGAAVTNVVMTDQVNGVGTIQQPPGLPQLTITASKGSCTQGGANGNVVSCQIGDMAGRESVTITIRGQVTAADGTTLNNTASVSATKSAQNFTTNASVSVLVHGGTGGGTDLPDLTLNKTGPTAVTVDDPFDYTLTVNNIGTANTANVRVVDTLPTGVTLQTDAFSTTSLFDCTSSGDPITVTCDGGTVNAGQNATIAIHAVAPGSTGTITNTAIVDPDNAIEESNELNNASATVKTTVAELPPPTPQLTIIKTDNTPDTYPWSDGAGPDPVNPGDQLTYKILVTNEADSRADDVVMTDGTQGLEASSIVASQVVSSGRLAKTDGCTVSAPRVRCSVRALDAGGTIAITITGTVVATAGSTIFNTATVTGNIKNTGVTATDSESTTVRPEVDLTITKAGSPNPVCARSWPDGGHLDYPPDGLAAAGGTTPALLAPPVCQGGLTYGFVVGNSGNGEATNVTVRDPLPTGTILDSYSTDGGFACSVASGVVTCTGGTIPAAGTRNISFVVVPPKTTGTITNTATVDPNNAIFEPDETNNTATATTDVVTGVDLVAWKSDSVDAASPGAAEPVLIPGTAMSLNDGYDPIATRGTETYTIYVDNVGTQDTTGIKVVDTLPADTVFLSVVADATHGFTCSHDGAATGGVITCVGGHLLGTEAEFYDPAGPTPAGPGDDFATIKIRVFARSTVGTMHNEVRVDPDNTIAEVNELNNTATDDTTVTVGNADKGAYHQLTVVKTNFNPASGTVATNGVLTYNLHVSNLGTDPVSNVVVKDTLPSGTRFISAADTQTGVNQFFCFHDGSATGGVVTCTGGDFDGTINDAGVGTKTRDVRITVFAPPAPGTATNLATVDPDNLVAEGNEFDNDSQLATSVVSCTDLTSCTDENAYQELTIHKTQVTPDNPVARNGIVTYDLEVANLGSDPVHGVVVTDRLPAGFRFINAADTAPGDTSAFTCAGPDASSVVTCSGGSLSGTVTVIPGPAPTTRHIRIRMFAPDTPGTYTNLAFVDPANAIPEGNEFNNQSSIDTVVVDGGNGPYIDLTATKVQITPDPATDGGKVALGGQLAYRITVTNAATGPDAGTAFFVRVQDVLPLHTAFFDAFDTGFGSPGAFTCSEALGVVECTGGTLPPGGSRDIIVALTAPTDITQFASDLSDIQVEVQNEVFVDPDNAIPEGSETNNFAEVGTTVRSKINLTLEKEGPSTANQNQTADYVITVSNDADYGGGAIAFNTKVVDYLPVGLIPLSVKADQSNMGCQIEENPVNLVTCVGDIEPGQPVVITVHVFITADGGPLDNEACVDPDDQIQETNELDNCRVKTTEVEPPAAPNLNINKSASKSTVTAGETFDYTVTASNVGNATASGAIMVEDTLPTEVTYQNATATNGFTCSESSGTVTCSGSDLAAGASTVVTIEVTVNDGVTSSFTNTASVSGAGQSKSASVTTNVGGASIDLVLSDITDTPDPANVGQNVSYTFEVTNSGTNASGAFDITAAMDDMTGLTFIGASASQGFTCGAIVVDTVICSGAGLPSGQTTEVKVTFQVTAGSPSTHTLTVNADSGDAVAEASEANNQQTELTSIAGSLCTGCIDLVIGGILDTPDPVADGQTLTFIVTASNAGDIPTTGYGPVDVHFDLPIGVDYVSATANAGFMCTYSDPSGGMGLGDYVDCTGDLAAGQGVVATITTTANDTERDTYSGLETLYSFAYVDPDDLFPEGVSPGDEFTNANNGFVIEQTSFPN